VEILKRKGKKGGKKKRAAEKKKKHNAGTLGQRNAAGKATKKKKVKGKGEGTEKGGKNARDTHIQ